MIGCAHAMPYEIEHESAWCKCVDLSGVIDYDVAECDQIYGAPSSGVGDCDYYR